MELGSSTGEGHGLAVGSAGIRDALGCQKPWMLRRARHLRVDCPLPLAGAKGSTADREEQGRSRQVEEQEVAEFVLHALGNSSTVT